LAKFGAPNLSAPNFGVTNFGASNFGASPMIAAPFGVVSPVSESEPRPAPVKLAITGVVPVDEFFRLLVVEAPASEPASVVVVMPFDEFSSLPAIKAPALAPGEGHVGQRHIDDNRQRSNQQGEPQSSQSEHKTLLV